MIDESASEDLSLAEAAQIAADALRQIAGDLRFRARISESPLLARALEAVSRRFVAGRHRQQVLRRSLQLYRLGILVSIDFMGEDTCDEEEAESATQEFMDLVRAASTADIEAGISVNLSHVGLAINRKLGSANCERIVSTAESTGSEVILNMEGDAYREDILGIYGELAPRFSNLGVTLQACLERTSEDLAACLALPGRIRLVKGAYDELGGRLIRGKTVDERFWHLTDGLLASGHRCSIATHDRELLHRCTRALSANPSGNVEFETLYGVAAGRQRWLRDLGYRVRTYIPYGSEYFLYLCHRLAEYPPNVHLAIRDIVSELQAPATTQNGGPDLD